MIIISATSSFLCNFLALNYNICNTALHVFTCDVLFMEINAEEMSYIQCMLFLHALYVSTCFDYKFFI